MYEPQQSKWNRQPSTYSSLRDDYSPDYLQDQVIYAPRPLRVPSDRLRPGSAGSLHYSPSYSPTYSPTYPPENPFETGLKQYLSESRPDYLRSPSVFPHRSPFSRPDSDPQLGKWEHDIDDYSEMLRMRPRDPREHRGVLSRQLYAWSMDQQSPRRIDSYHLGPNKNTVDLERIAQGLDTRTTVSWYRTGCERVCPLICFRLCFEISRTKWIK